MAKVKLEEKEVTFDDVITYIHLCTNVSLLKKINSVLDGAVIYAVNVVAVDEPEFPDFV